jgi:hypothetical protein
MRLRHTSLGSASWSNGVIAPSPDRGAGTHGDPDPWPGPSVTPDPQPAPGSESGHDGSRDESRRRHDRVPSDSQDHADLETLKAYLVKTAVED